MDFITLCSRSPDNELISGECEALTGSLPNPSGLAFCKTIESIPRAAYLTTGLQFLATGTNLQALASEIGKTEYTSEKFRIEYARVVEQCSVHKQEAKRVIADAIRGTPDLTSPLHRYMVICDKDCFYFGEILVEANRSYKIHDWKPYRTSSSLPSRLARALVNLACPAKTILDPCCGTGSILLEACATGIQPIGLDRNPKMVGMSRGNLEYFGYTAEVNSRDACQYEGQADAVVTDLPYGRFLRKDDKNTQKILKQMVHLAPLGIYVSEVNITDWLENAGYQVVDIYRIRKRDKFTRYVHKVKVNQ